MRVLFALAAACAAAVFAGAPAQAQSEQDFYRGKTVTLVVGFTPGGGYDTYARLLARHWGAHLPGKPAIVVQNMPGASGIASGNFLQDRAPRDGTTVAIFNKAMPMYEVLGQNGVRFKSKELTWIGSMEAGHGTIATWTASGITSMEEAKKRDVILGAVTANGSMGFLPAMANSLLGTRFKIISGYPGSTEVIRAMEQGEVQGIGEAPWSTWSSLHPQWVRDKTITVLAQTGSTPNPEIDAPLLIDLAPDERARQIIRFITADVSIGRTIVAPPALPAERTETLRRGFDKAMADKALLDDGAKAQLELSHVSGERVTQLIAELIDTPESIVKDGVAAIDPKRIIEREINKPAQ
jgi:tripartite-type tricarboxylate transporter receptor subunit TctC